MEKLTPFTVTRHFGTKSFPAKRNRPRTLKTRTKNKPHIGLPVNSSKEAKFVCQRLNT